MEISDKKIIIKVLQAPTGEISFETSEEFKDMNALIDLFTRITEDLKFQQLVNVTTQQVMKNMMNIAKKQQESKLITTIMDKGGFQPS